MPPLVVDMPSNSDYMSKKAVESIAEMARKGLKNCRDPEQEKAYKRLLALEGRDDVTLDEFESARTGRRIRHFGEWKMVGDTRWSGRMGFYDEDERTVVVEPVSEEAMRIMHPHLTDEDFAKAREEDWTE